jgi:hypothetical protein
LAGIALEVLACDGIVGTDTGNTTTESNGQTAMENHRVGNLITVTDSDLSSDAVVALNATSANQSGGISHA